MYLLPGLYHLLFRPNVLNFFSIYSDFVDDSSCITIFVRSAHFCISVYVRVGGGENIAPVPIEERIKQELEPVVSYAMLVGTPQQRFPPFFNLVFS